MSPYKQNENKLSNTYDLIIGTKKKTLQIETSKASSGGLVTIASVYEENEPGIISFKVCGDFSKRLEQSALRCTKKNVQEQHEKHLLHVDKLLEDAKAFYVKEKS